MLQTLNIQQSWPAAALPPGAEPAVENPIRLAADFVRRHFRTLLIAGLLGATLAIIVPSLLTEQYAATARLLVDPRDLKVLDKEVSPTFTPSDSSLALVESQSQVLSSDNVLKKVVAEQKLEADPEFNGERQRGLGAALRSMLGSEAAESADPASIALTTLRQKVAVQRIGKSFIIEVLLRSDDREKSQRIVASVVNAYLQDQATSRADVASSAGTSIDSGLEDLRTKVVDAERKVDTYKRENNLVGASGRLVNEQQLTEVNNQLIAAQAETERNKVRLASIRSTNRDLDRIPEALRSDTLRVLRGQLASVQAQKARLQAQLKPKHPLMRQLEEQETAARKQVSDELQRIKAGIQFEYERASANEQALTRGVEALQQRMNTTSAAQIRQRELESDLEASRSVYNTALLRAREAREQARVNTTNVRVISPPIAQWDRVFPPRRAVLAPIGFITGVTLAALALWLAEYLLGHGLLAEPRATAGALRLHPAPPAPVTPPRPAAFAEARVAPRAAHTGPGMAAVTRLRKRTIAQSSLRKSAPTVYADLRGLLSNGDPGVWHTGSHLGEPAVLSLSRAARTVPEGKLSARLAELLDGLGSLGSARKSQVPRLLSVTADRDSLRASAVALGLASVANRRGTRCLLLDADPLSRRLSRALAPSAVSGLADVLSGRVELAETIVSDPETGLDIVPAARTVSRTMQGFHHRLLAKATGYDLVIVDCGPLNASLREGPLLAASDELLLVVSSKGPDGEGELGHAARLPRLTGVVVTD